MRYALICREFQPLRVYHKKLDIIGHRLEKYAADHRIEGDTFAGTGSPGDEEMRHFGKVSHHGGPHYVFSKAYCQSML